MKTYLSVLFIASLATLATGQEKYLTNTGFVSFYSHTAIEDITAINNKVAAVIDGTSGDVAIIVVMSEFQFEKKLMQEHFNENYVESEKFPKATFNGRILNNEVVDYKAPGNYQVQVSGELTIHGISRDVTTSGSIEVTVDGITARTKFLLNPEEYEIKIPRIVRNNIAENMEITAELSCKPI
ncbi:MAG: YceI family protein [Bacteroidales bacterium]